MDTLEIIKESQKRINETKEKDKEFVKYLNRRYGAEFEEDKEITALVDLFDDDDMVDVGFFNMGSSDINEVIKWQTRGYLMDNLKSTIYSMKMIDTWQPKRAKENIGKDIQDLQKFKEQLQSIANTTTNSLHEIEGLIERLESIKKEIK